MWAETIIIKSQSNGLNLSRWKNIDHQFYRDVFAATSSSFYIWGEQLGSREGSAMPAKLNPTRVYRVGFTTTRGSPDTNFVGESNFEPTPKFESLKEHWSSVLSWRFCRHVKFFLYLRWTARLPWGQCNACQTKSNPCLQGWVYHNTRVTRHQLRWGIELRAYT